MRFRAIRCFFGKHSWGRWVDDYEAAPKIFHQVRWCRHCGIILSRTVDRNHP